MVRTSYVGQISGTMSQKPTITSVTGKKPMAMRRKEQYAAEMRAATMVQKHWRGKVRSASGAGFARPLPFPPLNSP